MFIFCQNSSPRASDIRHMHVFPDKPCFPSSEHPRESVRCDPARIQRMNGSALTCQLPTQTIRPRVIRCSDQPRTWIRHPSSCFHWQLSGELWGRVWSTPPSTGVLSRPTLKYYKVASQPFHEESAPQSAEPLRPRSANTSNASTPSPEPPYIHHGYLATCLLAVKGRAPKQRASRNGATSRYVRQNLQSIKTARTLVRRV